MPDLPDFEVYGSNDAALFSLKISRGEGMCLLGMDWRNGQPPNNFVGFAIEFQLPGANVFQAVPNRLSFLQNNGNVNPNILSSRLSPIQKFRWVHFPAEQPLSGSFTYRVTPVFMDGAGTLTYGDFQEAAVELFGETYPGQLDISFTRGFVASQAFVDRFAPNGDTSSILPPKADDGLTFTPTYANEAQALDWMGFEARKAILDLLDEVANDANVQVYAAAYDFNEPEVVNRLVALGSRVKIIIDDSGTHKPATSAESQAAQKLIASAGAANVQRQHMGDLQHNKMLVINGTTVKAMTGGSCNFSWRGFFVQNNNTVVVRGQNAVNIGIEAFNNIWENKNNAAKFGASASAVWQDLQLPDVKAKVCFSPHSSANAVLGSIATDIATTTSSLFYSLAFLYQTPGPILTSIETISNSNNYFVYGISDKDVGGLDVQRPDGNPPIAYPGALLSNVPEPFRQEVTGGSGITMHHKFVVIDADKPTARVYMGSHNFSNSADTKNAENLYLVADRRVAVSYMIEAVTMFDHYEFRDAQQKATSASGKLFLKTPPAQNSGVKPWFDEDYSNAAKARDRILFSK